MANLKMAVLEILDDDDDVDVEFLSHVEAAEAHALSLSASKRRRLTLPPSPPPPPELVNSGDVKVKLEKENDKEREIQEGAYTAALRGSKSLTWQKQSQAQSHAPPPSRAGGDACFKCGKEGHWARNCDQSSTSAAVAADVQKACPCGSGNCMVLTANTERNRGRKFFKCPIRQENGGCGFFEWCDESSGDHTSAEERNWKDGGQQVFYQRPSNQGTSGFTKPWNEYDNGSSSTNVQKFETTDNRSHDMRTGSTCFKCGKEGHWARDCPTPSSGTTTGVRGKTSSGTCYKCGASGHWAKDCTQGQSTKLRNW